jgi:MFS family permease
MLPKQSTHGHQDVQDATEEMGVELQATEAAVVSPTEAAVVSPIEADTGISSVTVDADKIIDSAAVEVESLYCSYSCCSNLLLVPAMIAGSDVITGLASGMTVKFFPIFFLFVLDLKPIEVQIIYLLTPFAIAFNAPILQEFSKKHGRITVTCIVKSLGVCLLLLLAFLTLETTDNKETLPHESFVDDDNWIDGGTDKSGNIPQEQVHAAATEENPRRNPGLWTWVIIVVYLVRTALMNSTKPLTKSVLMDFVPKSQRGRWQSLESVNAATWSGSAVVGGYLIDRYGFAGIFAATAVLQGVTILPLLRIRHLVPLEGDQKK